MPEQDLPLRSVTWEKPVTRTERFEIKARARGFKPEIDLLKLNRLVDELEIEEFKRKAADNAGPALAG